MSIPVGKERIYLHSPEAAIITVVDIAPAPPAEELASAIRRACARHGSLCSYVVRGAEGVSTYEQMQTPVCPVYTARLEDEFDWLAVADEQRATEFDIEAGELIRFILLEGEGHTQLIMIMHHLAGDGRSALIILRDIRSALANPAHRFTPLPMRNIDAGSMAAQARLSGMVSMMVKMCNRRWRQQGRFFTQADFTKLFDKFHAAPPPVVCSYRFDARRTEAILAACHDRRVRLTSALTAALAIAWGEKTEVGVTVSLRDKEDETLSNLSTGVTVAVSPKPGELWEVAEEAQGLLDNALGDPQRKFFLMRFMSEVEPTLIDAIWYQSSGLVNHPIVQQMSDLFGFGGRAKGISLSNVGNADMDGPRGGYTFSKLYMLPPAIPNALRTVCAVTLGGELSVTIQFADDENADGNAERFDDAMQRLEEATVSA